MMNILIDIGHPAHVHYFKNFYYEMEKKGHRVFISARDKECTLELLEEFNLPYINRGKGAGSIIGKVVYLFKADVQLYKYARSVNPDLFLSFGSPYAAQVSSMLGKPHIAFDDTEHAKLGHLMYMPFTETICTPFTFDKNLGEKQVWFDSLMELAALHPNQFNPDSSVLDILGIGSSEKYVILRFVSWGASHDFGATGIPDEKKEGLIQALSRYARVFISSEKALPRNLKKYEVNLPAHKLHDALYYASLYIGEGATMAAESALLGIPAIYINSLKTGNQQFLQSAGLLYDFRNFTGVQTKAVNLISDNNVGEKHKKKLDSFLIDKIDVTGFMIWFIENYPESIYKLENEPNYADIFK